MYFADEFGDTEDLENLNQQYNYYERARSDLEKLDSIEKNNPQVNFYK